MDQAERRALLDALISGKQCEIFRLHSFSYEHGSILRWNGSQLRVEVLEGSQWIPIEIFRPEEWGRWVEHVVPKYWDVEIHQGAPILPHDLMDFVRTGRVLRGRLTEVIY
jgi:hypothetical protein